VGTTWFRRVAAAAAIFALTVMATACGSDRGDDPAADDEGGGEATEAAAGEEGGDDGPVKFGDLDSPCGEGDASGAGDQGVTDDQIVIGYGDDAGFPQSPGLSHETTDAMEAMIGWCNEQGGINGRELVGKYYDAAITEVVNAVTQACGEVFMLVGQAWSLDSAQEEARLGCDLPSVPTYSVSPEFANAPLTYQAVPNAADFFGVGHAEQMAELFPEEAKRSSVMFGNFAATIDTKDKVVQAFPEHGFEFLDCPQEYNIIGETDWRPFAQKLKDCGAELVYYSGQPYPNLQNMLDASAQSDYSPIWLLDANAYLASFAEWNTSGNGDNVYLRSNFWPFEQVEHSPATQQYMDIVEADGGDISQLGQQTTSSFLLWATAADACGDDLTRDCVLDELSQTHSWTGGGLHTETDPGGNMGPECSKILKLEGTEWVQAHPEDESEFHCPDEPFFELSGRVVDQAELDENRISTTYAG
jgi:ABC-type branched-subunit amino acid transport system substrate-binding protein